MDTLIFWPVMFIEFHGHVTQLFKLAATSGLTHCVFEVSPKLTGVPAWLIFCLQT